MDPLIGLAVFPIIFLGELPDKDSSPVSSWRLGADPAKSGSGPGAFVVDVTLAVTLGLAIFALLPHRAVEGIVTAMFLFGSYAWREGAKDEEEVAAKEASRHSVAVTAFIVILIAEWGDSHQILTVNLALPVTTSELSVGVGAVLALWAVGCACGCEWPDTTSSHQHLNPSQDHGRCAPSASRLLGLSGHPVDIFQRPH